MNAVSHQSSQIDWVINYIEIDSRPVPSDEFHRLRICDGEIKIDPAGIVLSIGNQTERGLVLESKTASYLADITQCGNELVIKLQRENEPGSVMIVAVKSVCGFETHSPCSPSGTFKSHFEATRLSSFSECK